MLLTQLIAYIHWFFPGAAHQSIGFERAKDIILHKHWSLTPREDWGCKDVTQFSDAVIEKETLSNAASCHHGFGIKFRPQTKQKLDGQVEPFCIIFSLFCLLSLSFYVCYTVLCTHLMYLISIWCLMFFRTNPLQKAEAAFHLTKAHSDLLQNTEYDVQVCLY